MTKFRRQLALVAVRFIALLRLAFLLNLLHFGQFVASSSDSLRFRQDSLRTSDLLRFGQICCEFGRSVANGKCDSASSVMPPLPARMPPLPTFKFYPSPIAGFVCNLN